MYVAIVFLFFMSDIVFFGPPGSGKGTIGEILSRARLAHHISTGALIRKYLGGLPWNDPLHNLIAQGHYLNDDEVTALLIREVEATVSHRIVFDGYPRTTAQVLLLDRILHKYERELIHAVLFEISDERLVERISGRYNCRTCGRVYHRTFNPAPDETCSCGETQFEVRADDRAEVIEARLYKYHHVTRPIIDLYRQGGILRVVDADQPIDRVVNDVLDAVDSKS